MQRLLRTGRWDAAVASLALLFALGLFAGCGDTKKPAPKKADPAKKADVKTEDPAKPKEPVVKPEEPKKPDEPVVIPEEPKKPDEPVMIPEEPKKPEEPVVKPEEPKKPDEPVMIPEEPKKPEEPVVKPEEPKKPDEPVMIPEEPKKPEEPVVKPEEPKKPDEPVMIPEEPKKPEEPVVKPEEPVVKPEEPKKPEEPVAKPEEPKKPEEPVVKPAGDADPSKVKVSSFAPADDLVGQLEKLVADLTEAVASEEAFKDAEGKIEKDANTLIVIALNLGLHDQDNKFKKNAAAIVKAGQELAKAKTLEETKKGVEAVKAAAESGGEGPELKWEKVASLEQLMKAVPLINTKLKSSMRPDRFAKKAKDAAAYSAVIAAIGQASIADTSEAKTPEEVGKWQTYSVQMRDAAGALNAAIHTGDQAAAEKLMPPLAKSCDDCHEVFHKEALSAAGEEDK